MLIVFIIIDPHYIVLLIVKLLLSKNAHVDIPNNDLDTPLSLAIQKKHDNVIDLLIQNVSNKW